MSKELYSPPGWLCEDCRLSINNICHCPKTHEECRKACREHPDKSCTLEIDFSEPLEPKC